VKTTALLASLVASALLHSIASAWSETGHHIIAVLAFDQLSEVEQNELLRILAAHPRYVEDFTPPEKIRDVDRRRIGRAGYWPDVARGQPTYNRPTWHYQLASTLTIGDVSAVNVPETPGSCSPSANLNTRGLHIAQAVDLCRGVMGDKSQQFGDRAVTLTWIAHLVSAAVSQSRLRPYCRIGQRQCRIGDRLG